MYVEAKASAPVAGFNMTVRMGGTWRLTNLQTRQVVFDEFITATGHKTVGGAFVGTTRVRLAIEASAQAFIRDGLKRLSRPDLP